MGESQEHYIVFIAAAQCHKDNFRHIKQLMNVGMRGIPSQSTLVVMCITGCVSVVGVLF